MGKHYTNRYEVCLFYTKSDDYIFHKEKYFIPVDVSQLLADKVNFRYIKFYRENPKKAKQWFERLLNYGKMMTNVWDDIGHRTYSKCSEVVHPNEKPVRLIERCVLMSSNEGDIVLDCFGGSGSTYIAALRNNRKFIGCEIEKKWFDSICDKIKVYENYRKQ
jgi:DNA modification methylase